MILKGLNNSLVYSCILHLLIFFVFLFPTKTKAKPIYIPINITSIQDYKIAAVEKIPEKIIEKVQPQPKQESKPQPKLKPQKIVAVIPAKAGIQEKPVEPIKEPAKEIKENFSFALSQSSPKVVPQKTNISMQEETVKFEQNFEFVYYAKIIKTKISKNWKQVFVSGKNVKCVVYFKVKSSGEIVSIMVSKASGFPDFDASAVDAVKAANPFPALPENYPEDTLGVFFTFSQ